MSRNTSKSPETHFASFIKAQVQSERDGSANEVVLKDLRFYEEQDSKVKALQDALKVGLKSGEPRPLDFGAFKARKRSTFLER